MLKNDCIHRVKLCISCRYDANVLKSLRGDLPQTNIHVAKVFTVQLTSGFLQLCNTLDFFPDPLIFQCPLPLRTELQGVVVKISPYEIGQPFKTLILNH